MADYDNNLRLKEIATGAESGTWGTSTNTNLALIADAFGSGTEAITTNADTHTTTIANGVADEGRAIYMKYTGTLDSACTITLAPNTINKFWIIENATSGSQNIIISQGSGANITIGNGNVSAIFTDGAGSGAAVLDALADLELSGKLTVAGAATITGASTLTGVTTHGGNVVSDTDSTDDLGTTGVRWANLWVDAITLGGTLAGAVATFSSTVGITGVTTHGGNVVSDTDSTDDLGTTGVRWANLWVDAITMGGTLTGAIATFSGNVSLTGGVMAIGSTANAAVALNITSNDMAGTSQYGFNVNPNFTSDATAAGYGIRVLAGTDNASFTQTNTYGIVIESGSEGSGSTITNLYGLKIENQASGGTNYAIHTGTGTVALGADLTVATDVIIGTNPSSAGDIRLNKNFGIFTRNAANDANKAIITENVFTGADSLEFGDNSKWTDMRFHVSTANVIVLTSTLIALNKAVTMNNAAIKRTGLATSDPGVAGQLWNDSNTVKISAG